MQNWIVIAAAVIALVVVLLALAVVNARMLPAAPLRRSVAVSLGSAAVGVVAWLALGPVLSPHPLDDLYLPVAALAGVAAFLATIAVRASGAGIPVTLLFSAVWSALVFVPAAILSFESAGLTGTLGFEPVDHGGSLAVNVAAGAAALGVLLANGSTGARPRVGILPRRTGVLAMIALSVGWIIWLAGAELAFDDVTPSIVLNGIVGGLSGMAGWVIVQRISHQITTITGVAAGLVSGLVSITAGAPLFTPVSAFVAGIAAGAAACLFTLRTVASTRRQQWFIVGSHLLAGGVGVILLGLLATGTGFLFTGDPSIIYTGKFGFVEKQAVSVLLVGLCSAALSFLLWSVLKRLRVRPEDPA